MHLVGNQYKIQNLSLVELAEKYGTPVYIYDAEEIFSQIQNLNKAFYGLNFKIKYAVKALSNISVLKLMHKYGCGADTVSLSEIALCIHAGFAPSQITFTPNSVPFFEIEKAVEMGVYINIDNLNILKYFGKKFGNAVPCSIRINPHIMAGGNLKISTGHVDSKFGISIDQKEGILNVINEYDINVTGIHVHTGSDVSEKEVFMKVSDIVLELAKQIKSIKIVDFGGGFKVPYKAGDHYTDIDELGQVMIEKIQKFSKEYGTTPEVWVEPGKYLVSKCGVLLASVTVLKRAANTTFVGIDTGLNHLVRPMMYGAYHEIVNISNLGGALFDYSVVGNICETDTFAWNRSLSEVREGDLLAILNAGAYGFSMSSQYNSRVRPPEVLIYQGKDFLIRKRETLDDILKNQVEINF